MTFVVIEVPRPGAAGPVIGDLTVHWPVGSGVERPEPSIVCGAAHRSLRKGLHELGYVTTVLVVTECVVQDVLALSASQRLRDMRVLDLGKAVVRCSPQVADFHL